MTLSPDLLHPGPEAMRALCAATGAILAAVGLPALLAPCRTAPIWRAFPRSIWPGRLLAALALAWAALWLMVMPLGPMTFLRRWMVLLYLVAVPAVWFLCDELLACRAVGGLLALVPSALLPAAQWHPSAMRFVPLVTGYLFAIAAMFLIAQPWHLRDLLHWGATAPSRMRLLGGVLSVLALALLATAVLA